MSSLPSTPLTTDHCVKVFVQRDYSDGTSVKFHTRFPPELEERVNLIHENFEHLFFLY